MCPATQHNGVRNRVPISTIALASANRVPALVMLGRNCRHLHRECFGLRPIDGLGQFNDILQSFQAAIVHVGDGESRALRRARKLFTVMSGSGYFGSSAVSAVTGPGE